MDSNITNPKKNSIDIVFIIWWTIANSIGLTMSLSLLRASEDVRDIALIIMVLIISGAIIGMLQVAVLCFKIEVEKWVLLSMIGWGVGVLVGSLVAGFFGGWLGDLFLPIILGASLGVAQMFSLYEQDLSIAHSWATVCGIGLAVSLFIGSFLGGIINVFFQDFAVAIAFLISGAIYGIITGLYLNTGF